MKFDQAGTPMQVIGSVFFEMYPETGDPDFWTAECIIDTTGKTYEFMSRAAVSTYLGEYFFMSMFEKVFAVVEVHELRLLDELDISVYNIWSSVVSNVLTGMEAEHLIKRTVNFNMFLTDENMIYCEGAYYTTVYHAVLNTLKDIIFGEVDETLD